FHAQTGGSTLTAQQPENNIVRVAIQALSAVAGGAQSLHTNAFDEALALPTEGSAKIALRTQQILATEAGGVDTADPLGGAYFIEALTDELEARAWDLIEQIDELGGAVAAIEQGFVQDEIEQAAFSYQQELEAGERVLVGVNRFREDEREPIELHRLDPAAEHRQVERTAHVRAERNAHGPVQENGLVRILLVSQMYPGPDDPDLGVFVRGLELALRDRGLELELAVLDRRAGGKLRYLELARRVRRAARPDVVYAHFL